MYALATLWVAGAVTQFRTPDSSINSAFAGLDSVAAGFRALSDAVPQLDVPLAASPPRALAELRDALTAAGGGTLADANGTTNGTGTVAPEAPPAVAAVVAATSVLSEKGPGNVTAAGGTMELLPGRNWTAQRSPPTANETEAMQLSLRTAGENATVSSNVTVTPAENLAEVRANATGAVRGVAKVWEAIGMLNGAVASHAGRPAEAPLGLRAARRRPPPVALVEQGQPGWDGLYQEKHHVSAWVPATIVGGVFGSYGLWRTFCGPKSADDLLLEDYRRD